MNGLLTKLGLGVLGLFVLIQLVPYGRAHENPPVTGEPEWDSPETEALFKRTCADCHSHETRWPWYASIAPASWLVTQHVTEGREHFNVSAWGTQEHNEGEEAAEELEHGEMPIRGYTMMHPEAALSGAERAKLIAGLIATFGEEHHEGEQEETHGGGAEAHGEDEDEESAPEAVEAVGAEAG